MEKMYSQDYVDSLLQQINKLQSNEKALTDTLMNIERELGIKDKKDKYIRKALSNGVTAYYILEWDSTKLIDFHIEDESINNFDIVNVENKTYADVIDRIYKEMICEDERDTILEQLKITNIKKILKENDYHVILIRKNYYSNSDYFQMTFNKLNEAYGEKAFIVTVRNINASIEKELVRKRELKEALEKAQVASQSKTNFLFNMSHDIRTPMNAILGYVGVAKKYIDKKEKVLDCLEKLENAGEHLQRLINDVLNLAKIENGKSVLRPTAGHIPSSLEKLKEVFAIDMEKKNMNFIVNCDVHDETVMFDRLKMDQIELNLIGNALKYTPENGTITYTIKQLGESYDGYALYQGVVEDNGIGMSKEFIEHVFDSFEREQNTTHSKVEGNGLGLAITKKLLEQMDGDIVCESELGKGTKFTYVVNFPIAKEESKSDSSSSSEIQIGFEGTKILLVEDNKLNQEIAIEILKEFGFDIDIADDGDIAVDIIANSEEGYYKAILMDIQMPTMNGYEATKHIRNLDNKKLANIPIIAITANAFDEDVEKAKSCGMDGHIAKPIHVKTLINVLSEILNDK